MSIFVCDMYINGFNITLQLKHQMSSLKMAFNFYDLSRTGSQDHSTASGTHGVFPFDDREASCTGDMNNAAFQGITQEECQTLGDSLGTSHDIGEFGAPYNLINR